MNLLKIALLSANQNEEIFSCILLDTKEYFIIAIFGSSRRGRALLSALSHEGDCKRRIDRLLSGVNLKFAYIKISIVL